MQLHLIKKIRRDGNVNKTHTKKNVCGNVLVV